MVVVRFRALIPLLGSTLLATLPLACAIEDLAAIGRPCSQPVAAGRSDGGSAAPATDAASATPAPATGSPSTSGCGPGTRCDPLTQRCVTSGTDAGATDLPVRPGGDGSPFDLAAPDGPGDSTVVRDSAPADDALTDGTTNGSPTDGSADGLDP